MGKFIEKDEDKTKLQHDTIKSTIAGAAAGTTAAFVVNPISQISNMKSSHPEKFGNKKWPSVAAALYNTPNYNSTQRQLAGEIANLENHIKANSSIPSLQDITKAHTLKLETLKNVLTESKPKRMGIRAFYSGFGSKALNNAAFSAIMFGSIPMYKHLIDKAQKKKLNISIANNNEQSISQ